MPVPCRWGRVRAGNLGGPWGGPSRGFLAGGCFSRDPQMHGVIGGCWEVIGQVGGWRWQGEMCRGSLGVSSRSWGLRRTLGGSLQSPGILGVCVRGPWALLGVLEVM